MGMVVSKFQNLSLLTCAVTSFASDHSAAKALIPKRCASDIYSSI